MIMINRLIALIRRYPLIPAMFSMGWNLAYTAFNGVLGLAYSSYWYITLCAFYTTLGFMRLSIITISKSKKRTETSVMRHIGYGLIAFSIVLVGITLLSIREQQNPFRHRIVMITIAAYTFFIAGWSIYNIIKAHRKKSVMMIMLRNISCAGAIGSVLFFWSAECWEHLEIKQNHS